jgi:hypothetical protein
MRINRCWILAAGMSLLPMLVVADSRDEARAGKIRWDIIHIVTFSPMGNTIDAGGKASALAQNNSMITVTGSGTFRIGDSDDVTGGGTWQTFDPPPASTPTGAGNYRVTGLVRFEVAPGAQASNAKDLIGDGTLADNRGGLAILRIAYSDGSKGILVVSCDLPGNPPPGPAGSRGLQHRRGSSIIGTARRRSLSRSRWTATVRFSMWSPQIKMTNGGSPAEVSTNAMRGW